jgi:hypothetical protein
MKLNKLILGFASWLVFTALPIYAGELYELEEYLSAINVDNPYGDTGGGGAPVGNGSPFSPDGGSRNAPTSGPALSNGGSGGGGIGNWSSFGGGSFNSLSNPFSTSRWQPQRSNQSQGKTNTRDYLTQALLTNTGGLVLRRDKGTRHAKKATQAFCFEDIQAVSVIPRRIREVWDKQIVHQKVQRAVKTPYERCYQTTLIADGYICDGFTLSVSSLSMPALILSCSV